MRSWWVVELVDDPPLNGYCDIHGCLSFRELIGKDIKKLWLCTDTHGHQALNVPEGAEVYVKKQRGFSVNAITGERSDIPDVHVMGWKKGEEFHELHADPGNGIIYTNNEMAAIGG